MSDQKDPFFIREATEEEFKELSEAVMSPKEDVGFSMYHIDPKAHPNVRSLLLTLRDDISRGQGVLRWTLLADKLIVHHDRRQKP